MKNVTLDKFKKRAMNITEFNSVQIPVAPCYLGELFYAGAIGMLYGPRGSGKSLLAMIIGYAVTAEKLVPPWGKGQGGIVCYVDGEMRARGLRDRICQLDGFNADETSRAKAAENFYVVSRDFVGHPIGSIDTEEGQAAIDKMLPPDVDLIILDNLSAWTNSGGEDIRTWQLVKSWLIGKRLQGVSVLMLHHAGKSGGQRGTSAHEDLLDFSLQLTPLPLENEPEKTHFRVDHTKLRDHLPALKAPYVFTIWSENGVMRFKSEQLVTKFDDRIANILELQAQGLNQTQIAEKLEVDKGQISRALKKYTAQQSEMAQAQSQSEGGA